MNYRNITDRKQKRQQMVAKEQMKGYVAPEEKYGYDLDFRPYMYDIFGDIGPASGNTLLMIIIIRTSW